MHFKRLIDLPRNPTKSIFLWGMRQTGKSTLLRENYPDAKRIDLLKSDEFASFAEDPSRLRRIVASSKDRFVIIDEVQKIPALLDEVHFCIEEQQARFILCGSSARKLKKGAGNLLGGRALRYELSGLVAEELGKEFDIERLLNFGNLPSHYLSEDPASDLDSYV